MSDKPESREDLQDWEDIAPDSLISAQDSMLYWEGVDASVDGMLGGFEHISKIELRGSRAFLAKLGFGRQKGLREVRRALEGGAGIGRVTDGLLLEVCNAVDVVEPVAKFTDRLRGLACVDRIFHLGLEDWRPLADDQYDLVWCQWCTGHLTDQQLVDFLLRAKRTLSRDDNGDGEPVGCIVFKENVTTAASDVFDEQDSSVTRTDGKYREIFDKAGLRVVRVERQCGLPASLYPVAMYAMRP